MWLLTNETPFAAERTWVRDENGAEVWLVAVKGSFLIQEDGRSLLNPLQTEVSRVPKFRGDPATTSLLFESDLIHKKICTDVIVHGHAYAPGERPYATVDVRLKIANIDKTLRIYGDRVVEGGFLGVSASDAQPFTKMPITYERSFGGTDQQEEDPKNHDWEPRNPVGVGFGRRAEHVLGKAAPNVEHPNSPYTSHKRGTPAAFGPIARHWSPRVGYAGTYDDRWEEERMPLLPLDFDDKFYQCAPEDQQTEGFLKGGEIVELFNMTPGGYLIFDLPRVWFALSTQLGSERIEHRANLHTVIIEPDVPQVVLVWHSALPCHGKETKLYRTIVRQKEYVRLGQVRHA